MSGSKRYERVPNDGLSIRGPIKTENSDTLGLKLVSLLVDQLEGDMKKSIYRHGIYS